MLPKEQRVRDTKDFKRIYGKGSFFFAKYFNINYLPNKTHNARLGFVVSKKVNAKAIVRNKIKRQFREASRKLYQEAPKGYDIVISIKKEALGVKYSELETEIQKALQKIGKNEKNISNNN